MLLCLGLVSMECMSVYELGATASPPLSATPMGSDLSPLTFHVNILRLCLSLCSATQPPPLPLPWVPKPSGPAQGHVGFCGRWSRGGGSNPWHPQGANHLIVKGLLFSSEWCHTSLEIFPYHLTWYLQVLHSSYYIVCMKKPFFAMLYIMPLLKLQF